MRFIAVIPARMGSSRFPGKPLADICGKTMIEHVWQRVKMNRSIEAVYIITCDGVIAEAARAFGAEVIMTSDKHTRCTDRAAEAASTLNFEVMLNIQGDEPLLNPAALDLLIKPFNEERGVMVVNLIEELNGEQEIANVNNVKAVIDQRSNILYMSRLPIPQGNKSRHYKQLGLYALTREAILQYARLGQTPLEVAESDDMLRFIENGIMVKAVLSPYKTKGVDTPQDQKEVSALMMKDGIFRRYK